MVRRCFAYLSVRVYPRKTDLSSEIRDLEANASDQAVGTSRARSQLQRGEETRVRTCIIIVISCG